MTIVNAGRTGVERGAYHGAVAVGFDVIGVCRRGQKDELGPLPPDLAARLEPCDDRGARAAVARCLQLATAVLIVVPDRDELAAFPFVTWLGKRVRGAGIPLHVHDPKSAVDDTLTWTLRQHRLYVTGPRGTRWLEGESVARRLLRETRPIEAIA